MKLSCNFAAPQFFFPMKVRWEGDCCIQNISEKFNFVSTHTKSCSNKTFLGIGFDDPRIQSHSYDEHYICESCMLTYWGTSALEYAYKVGVVHTQYSHDAWDAVSRRTTCTHQRCTELGIYPSGKDCLCIEHAFQRASKMPGDATAKAIGELYSKFPYLKLTPVKEKLPFPHRHYAPNDMDRVHERILQDGFLLEAHPDWRELTDLGRQSRYALLSAEKQNRAEELREKFIALGIIKENR